MKKKTILHNIIQPQQSSRITKLTSRYYNLNRFIINSNVFSTFSKIEKVYETREKEKNDKENLKKD